MEKYKVKAVRISEEGSSYLVAVPYNKDLKNGFRIFLTDKLEKFDERFSKPLIDAVLYKTPDEAIEAGEEICRIDSNAIRGL